MTLRRLHWLLIVGSIVLPATSFGFAALHSRFEGPRAGKEATNRTANMMREQALRTLETGEIAFAQVNDHIRNMEWDEIPLPETNLFLARLDAYKDHLSAVWITDSNGVVRAASRDWDPALNAVFDQAPYFQRPLDAITCISSPFEDAKVQCCRSPSANPASQWVGISKA